MDFLNDLNEQQQQAVEAGDGPVLIMAGPGTGKTKTLTARIAYLLQKGVDPQRILALTFTVKAAEEMRQRVTALMNGAPPISTFHALGYRILNEANPGDDISFISEAERQTLIRDLPQPKELGGLTARELGLAISRFKGAANSDQSSAMGRLVQRYQSELKQRSLYDFDDLLFKTRQLFDHNTTLQANWRSRYDYILIDEFQDTSELQWALITHIRGTENVFVIGDPKQSIYGFRGASTDMFARFRADFPQYTEVALQVNYRSAKAIVQLASAIFGGKDALRAHTTEVGLVRAVQTLNEFSEADFVLAQIEQGIGGSDLLKTGVDAASRQFKDFAVLYRTHHTAKIVQQRLHDSGIPFQVVGEGSPYDQPEVQAVIGLLRRLAGEDAPAPPGFSDGQVKVLLEKIDVRMPVSKLAEVCAAIFALASDSRKQQRLVQFVSTLVRFDNLSDGLSKLLEYLERIAQEGFYDPDADAVTLLTIHASKGLEFAHVILIAAEEGILPHIRKRTPTDFDEERRLFYVAATRAMSQLDILYAKKRSGEPREPSRYIVELSEQALPRELDPTLSQLEKKQKRREQKARQTTLL